jgi:hypothetical protein
MGLLSIVFDVVAGLLKVLEALMELEIARSKRKEDHAEARRPRHLKK